MPQGAIDIAIYVEFMWKLVRKPIQLNKADACSTINVKVACKSQLKNDFVFILFIQNPFCSWK